MKKKLSMLSPASDHNAGGLPASNVEKKPQVVTQQDIADRVGVSASLVSKALCGTAHKIGTSPDTIARIQNAAKELGYVPSGRIGKTKTTPVDTNAATPKVPPTDPIDVVRAGVLPATIPAVPAAPEVPANAAGAPAPIVPSTAAEDAVTTKVLKIKVAKPVTETPKKGTLIMDKNLTPATPETTDKPAIVESAAPLNPIIMPEARVEVIHRQGSQTGSDFWVGVGQAAIVAAVTTVTVVGIVLIADAIFGDKTNQEA